MSIHENQAELEKTSVMGLDSERHGTQSREVKLGSFWLLSGKDLREIFGLWNSGRKEDTGVFCSGLPYVARTFDFLEEAEKKQTRNLNWEIEEFR